MSVGNVCLCSLTAFVGVEDDLRLGKFYFLLLGLDGYLCGSDAQPSRSNHRIVDLISVVVPHRYYSQGIEICHYSLRPASALGDAREQPWYKTRSSDSHLSTVLPCTSLFNGAQMPPTTAPMTLRPSSIDTTQLAPPLILTPALAYPRSSSTFLAPTALSVLKQPNMPVPLAPSFSYSSIFCAKQLWTMSGESVMQYWKQPSLSSELTMTGVEDADGDDVVESGAE